MNYKLKALIAALLFSSLTFVAACGGGSTSQTEDLIDQAATGDAVAPPPDEADVIESPDTTGLVPYKYTPYKEPKLFFVGTTSWPNVISSSGTLKASSIPSYNLPTQPVLANPIIIPVIPYEPPFEFPPLPGLSPSGLPYDLGQDTMGKPRDLDGVATGGSVRFDAATNTDANTMLVVYETKEGLIRSRIYNSQGAKINQGADPILSRELNNDGTVFTGVDPAFAGVFPGIKEPQCTTFHNPSVVYLADNWRTTPSEQKFFVAYEAECTASVKVPNRAELVRGDPILDGNGNRLFDLENTEDHILSFKVIKGVFVDATKGTQYGIEHPGVQDFFARPRTISRLYAWVLANNENNGAQLVSNRSIWNWSTAESPDLSVNAGGRVLISYATNLKYSRCLRIGEDLNLDRYGRLFSIDGRIIAPAARRLPAFSIFRSGDYTVADGEEVNAGACTDLRDGADIVSAYEPSSAGDDANKFTVLYSTESGSADEHNAESKNLESTISGTILEHGADNPVVGQNGFSDTVPNFQRALASDIALAKSVSTFSDIVFDRTDGLFVGSYDDAQGIHLILSKSDGHLLGGADIVSSYNWADPFATSSVEPRLSTPLAPTALGDESSTKIGVVYLTKLAQDKWHTSENYIKLKRISDNKLDVAFERKNSLHYDLMLQADAGTNGVSPVALSLSGARGARFRSFWASLPGDRDNNTIKSAFAPEGRLPTPQFTMEKISPANGTSSLNGNTLTVKLNPILPNALFAIRLNGAQSSDPDVVPPALNNGIISWNWKIVGETDAVGAPLNYNFVGSGQLIDNGLQGISKFGTYRVELEVTDVDGLKQTTTKRIVLKQNLPPSKPTITLTYLNGAVESPIVAGTLVPKGSQVRVAAESTDQDREDGTPQAQLKYNWTILQPNNTVLINQNLAQVDGTRKMSFVADLPGMFTISATAVDAEGSQSEVSQESKFEAADFAINNFGSPAVKIDLDPASTANNPSPASVYGRGALNYSTLLADSVKIVRKEWVSADGIGAAVEEDLPVADIISGANGGVLPTSTMGVNIEVKVRKKTSYWLVAKRGAVEKRSDPVVIEFNTPTIVLAGVDALIPYDAVNHRGVLGNINWSSTNIKELHLRAFEWARYDQAPVINWDQPTRNLDGAADRLPITGGRTSDNLTRKTTYVIRATDLFGNIVEVKKDSAFINPAIASFSSSANAVDFMAGKNLGEATLSWRSTNASSVAISANGAPANIQGLVVPDGSKRVELSQNTDYIITALNPDGRSVTSAPVRVVINAPAVTEWSVVEASVRPRGTINLRWKTKNSLILDVAAVAAGGNIAAAQSIYHTEDWHVAQDSSSTGGNIPVVVPAFMMTGGYDLILKLQGPGGAAQSARVPLTVLPEVAVNSFSTIPDTPEARRIVLKAESIAGNPDPSAVYGEVKLAWVSTAAQTIMLKKQEQQPDGSYGAQVDVPQGDLSIWPLPFESPAGGVTARVYRNTIFTLKAQSADAEQTKSVTIEFMPPQLGLTVRDSDAAVPEGSMRLLNDAQNGSLSLTWSSTNVREVKSVDIYEWSNFSTRPDVNGAPTRSIKAAAGSYLPLLQAVAIADTATKKSTYVIRGVAVNGESMTQSADIAFESPTLQKFISDDALIGFEIGSSGTTVVRWETRNAKAIAMSANGAAAKYIDPNDPARAQLNLFPHPTGLTGIGATRVLLDLNSTYALTLTNPDGVVVTNSQLAVPSVVVNFQKPTITSITAAEQSARVGDTIHASWKSETAKRADIILSAGGRDYTLYTENDLAKVRESNDVAMIIPDGIPEGEGRLRIELQGPGGANDPLALNLRPAINIVASVRIDSFTSNVEGQLITVPREIMEANPAPSGVYAEIFLTWRTTQADVVKLYRKQWQSSLFDDDPNIAGAPELLLVPASEMPGRGAQDVEPLPLSNAGTPLKVRSMRNTTFVFEAWQGQNVTRREVVVKFADPRIDINAATPVDFSNVDNRGVANLTWNGENIREAHLSAYAWSKFDAQPDFVGGRSLDPVAGNLELVKLAAPKADNITKKTSYIMKVTDLYGNIIEDRTDVEFSAPQITTLTALPNPTDFVVGAIGESVLSYQSKNIASVAVTVNGVPVPYIDPNDEQRREIAEYPIPTGLAGSGSSRVRLTAKGTYLLTATNPDGRVATSQVEIAFNNPTIQFGAVAPTLDQAIYLGREVSVSWTATNSADITLRLVDAAGNIVAGFPSKRLATIEAVNNPPWKFILPNPSDPQAAGVIYRIKAEMANPNGGFQNELSDPFTAQRRPSPKITSFTLQPVQIADLVLGANGVEGSSMLAWQLNSAADLSPVVSIERKKSGGNWEILPLDYAALLPSGQTPVVVGVADAPVEYRITARGKFDDRVISGAARGFYADDPVPPADPIVSFVAPTIQGFSVAEAEIYPQRSLHFTWNTKTGTSLALVFIRDGVEQTILSDNDFAKVSASANRAVAMPEFAGEGAASLRLDLTGPGGIIKSALLPIQLKQVPATGVFNFCVPIGAGCVNNPSVDFTAGKFASDLTLRWIVNPDATERVARICIGDAPNNDGACSDVAHTIDLPAGTNYVDQGNGNGIGSIDRTVDANTVYWLVTQPKGMEILVGYGTPLNLSFNKPAIAALSSDRTIVNQNMKAVISWNGVKNATGLEVRAAAGNDVKYRKVGVADWLPLPFSPLAKDVAFLPAGSIEIMTTAAANMTISLVATGPGGTATAGDGGSAAPVQIAVNDVPAIAPLIQEPAVQKGMFAPTRLYLKWKASEASLDDDVTNNGIVVDNDGIGKYAVCYDIYKSDASGNVPDRAAARLAGKGIACPDLLNTAYATTDDLPAGTILVDPKLSAQCAQAGSKCIVTNNVKSYYSSLELDPKLNDPANGAEYLLYEIRVMTIDRGRNNQIIGIRTVDTVKQVVTDDSVEAWWKFNTDFTAANAPDCQGAPAGYKICDASRMGHHASAVGGPTWGNPGIVLNPNNEKTQWAVVDGRFSAITDFAVEADLRPDLLARLNYMLWLSMGSGAEDAIVDARISNKVAMTMRDPLYNVISVTGTTILTPGTEFTALVQCDHLGQAMAVRNGIVEAQQACLPGFSVPDAKRFVRIGASHLSDSNPYYIPFNGRIRDLAFYVRPLSVDEMINHNLARTAR